MEEGVGREVSRVSEKFSTGVLYVAGIITPVPFTGCSLIFVLMVVVYFRV